MTQLRKREPPPWLTEPVSVGEGRRTHRVYAVGDCWYASPDGEGGWTMYPDGPGSMGDPLLHRARLTQLGTRHVGVVPIIVVLPSQRTAMGDPWCVHNRASSGAEGWEVTGGIEGRPDLTLRPSVHTRVGEETDWHGHITDGRLQ